MYSSRFGGGRPSSFDARSRIEVRRRAQVVQQKVDAIRRLRNQQQGRRLSTGDLPTSSGIVDLNVKLARSRRNRLSNGGDNRQQLQRQKTFPNFTVVTDIEPEEETSPAVRAITHKLGSLRRSTSVGNMANFTRTIVNDRANKSAGVVLKRRSDSGMRVSPLKRRRQVSGEDASMDNDYSPPSRSRPLGPLGVFFSAMQDAQSQESRVSSGAATARMLQRPVGTMVADVEQQRKPMRIPIHQRLSASSVSPMATRAKVVEGYRVLITQLNNTVTSDDLQELFSTIGLLNDAYLIEPGLGEVIFQQKSDAERAVDEFHNRKLDGVPMQCQLLSSMTVTSGKRQAKSSTMKLSGRFQGEDNCDSVATAGVAGSGDGPIPNRDLVTSVLFGGKAGTLAKGDVTFTVKV